MQEPQKYKVCHLTSAHPDKDIRIFLKECVSLANAGYETYLVLPNAESRIEKGVHIVSFESVFSSRRERMMKTVNQVLKEARKIDADLYHFHDPELLRVALKLKKGGKKVVYDVHEDLPKQILGKYWINKNLRKWVAKGFRRFENQKAKKMSGIITATTHIAERFLSLNKNTITVNNYPFTNELQPVKESNADVKNAVCYVGGITKIRGLSELVEAMSFCPNTKLILAGPVSPKGYLDELKSLKGWSQVEFLGQVDRQGVADILGRSFAGIVTFYPLPNHVDAQPNKMFEYMSAGLPVIGSHFPLWKEIIETNKAGLCVDPQLPSSIADAINKLCQNRDLVQQMGENGREAVLLKFNWEKEQEKLISFYQRLLKN